MARAQEVEWSLLLRAFGLECGKSVPGAASFRAVVLFFFVEIDGGAFF